MDSTPYSLNLHTMLLVHSVVVWEILTNIFILLFCYCYYVYYCTGGKFFSPGAGAIFSGDKLLVQCFGGFQASYPYIQYTSGQILFFPSPFSYLVVLCRPH